MIRKRTSVSAVPLSFPISPDPRWRSACLVMPSTLKRYFFVFIHIMFSLFWYCDKMCVTIMFMRYSPVGFVHGIFDFMLSVLVYLCPHINLVVAFSFQLLVYPVMLKCLQVVRSTVNLFPVSFNTRFIPSALVYEVMLTYLHQVLNSVIPLIEFSCKCMLQWLIVRQQIGTVIPDSFIS